LIKNAGYKEKERKEKKYRRNKRGQTTFYY